MITPTGKGKQLAHELACVFASVRKELFAGIQESDIGSLGRLLPQLQRNAARMRSRSKHAERRRRIGARRRKQIELSAQAPPRGDAISEATVSHRSA